MYDFGGGTFDISILSIKSGVFEVKSTNGDTNCGGEDIDVLLMDFLLSEFELLNNINLKNDKIACQRVKEQCEKAKIELS